MKRRFDGHLNERTASPCNPAAYVCNNTFEPLLLQIQDDFLVESLQKLIIGAFSLIWEVEQWFMHMNTGTYCSYAQGVVCTVLWKCTNACCLSWIENKMKPIPRLTSVSRLTVCPFPPNRADISFDTVEAWDDPRRKITSLTRETQNSKGTQHHWRKSTKSEWVTTMLLLHLYISNSIRHYWKRSDPWQSLNYATFLSECHRSIK